MWMADRQTSGACHIHEPGRRGANRSLILLIAGSLLLLAISTIRREGVGTIDRFAPLFLDELELIFLGPRGMVAELIELFPYILAGVLIAGYIRTKRLALKLQAKLRRFGWWSVVAASLVGLISPLCACGTVTTAVGLLFAGVPIAPVMALMVTSPLMSPSTYLITLNDLGPEWTAARTIAAFALGTGTGLVTLFLCRFGFDRGGIFRDGSVVRGDLHSDEYPDERLRCNCRNRFGNRVASRTGNQFLVFLAKSAEMLVTVGKYVVIGIFVGAVVERSIPPQWLARYFGGDDPLNVVWVTLASVPVFLHQISASGILSHIRESLPGVMDSRAALAFMIGGPVTAVPTMAIFLSLLKPRFFALYLFSCVVGTIAVSMVSGLFFTPGVSYGAPLFRGVRSLPGGGTFFVRTGTTDRSPIPLLQVEGRVLITAASDDPSGRGGVVVDGNRARFLGLDDPDVARYTTRVAAFLDAHQTVSSGGVIRIVTNDGRSAQALVTRLAGGGYRSEEIPAEGATVAHDSSQYWIFADSSTILSQAFLDELSSFREKGGGVLLVVEGGGGGLLPFLQRVGVQPVGSITPGGRVAVTSPYDPFPLMGRWVSMLAGLKTR